jgi:hypothetical protein
VPVSSLHAAQAGNEHFFTGHCISTTSAICPLVPLNLLHGFTRTIDWRGPFPELGKSIFGGSLIMQMVVKGHKFIVVALLLVASNQFCVLDGQ